MISLFVREKPQLFIGSGAKVMLVADADCRRTECYGK